VVIVPQVAAIVDGSISRKTFAVLLVDRQPLFLAALAELLSSPPLEATVRTMTDSALAVEIATTTDVDLVVCEVGAKPLSGRGLIEAIAAGNRAVPVVLLGDREDGPKLISAMSSGAVGFFTKESSWEEFAEGLTAIRAGHFALGSDLAQGALSRLSAQPGGESNDWRILSNAERMILTLVGQAQSLDSIALARGVSKKTVRNHLATIYRKLNLKSRTEAMLWAVRTGLVDAAASEPSVRD
jgi:DNA-binding NarL/FixJ family response regulator